MTIMQLGALGEFFGSIVVFVTLIYVALQIRLARRELKRNVQNSWLQAVRDNWVNRIQNPQLLDAMLKADSKLEPPHLQGPFMRVMVEQAGLTPREAYLLLCDQIVQWQHWVATIENLEEVSPATVARMNAAIKTFYQSSYGKVFWEHQREQNIERAATRYIEAVLAT